MGKTVFSNIEQYLSYLRPFILQKKVATPSIRVEKNFFKIVREGYQKEAEFCTDLKNV
jgi:hypothetical protein